MPFPIRPSVALSSRTTTHLRPSRLLSTQTAFRPPSTRAPTFLSAPSRTPFSSANDRLSPTAARMFSLSAHRANQPKTFSNQNKLPRLPVPDLEKSLEGYLKSLAPLLEQKVSTDEFAAVVPILTFVPVRRLDSAQGNREAQALRPRFRRSRWSRACSPRTSQRPRSRITQQLARRHPLARASISHLASTAARQFQLVAALCARPVGSASADLFWQRHFGGKQCCTRAKPQPVRGQSEG